jgi:hypothetical protein
MISMNSRAARIAAIASVCLAASSARAQLIAFPGAEGAARNVSGGRGGDVYHVTNLNNAGAGSLRDGISTATVGGRTIVFDVAGTINLTSSLDFNGKSNITIAGQTAPAGGVTLANHRLRINNASNVIVQFLRVRPGNTYGSQDPDAIWVAESTGVMLDHITASWGVDETISTTHNSNNVSVQWSTISQGLYDGGHSEGAGHSYGSLINGGTYTYHHNLYAHNKSRNPRPQSSGNYLRLDFVNNVLFNPQDRFGYSDGDDPYDVNLVGNYAIKGPKSGSNNALMRPDDIDSKFFVNGNYTDLVRNGLVDGSAVNGSQVFGAGDPYTLSPIRFDAGLPQVQTHSAAGAYVQVLSRAGAVNFRDPVDRRLIHSVMNQLDWSIDTQAEVGGWPTLPTGAAAPDANGDGVPDNWATANGFTVGQNLHQTTAPDGYTYLEKYIHSRTPYAYAPVGGVQHTVSTAFGMGADAQVNENGGLSAVSTGNGTAATMDVAWGGSTGSVNQAMVLRFDLSQVQPGSINAARLELTAAAALLGTHQFKIYGLTHDAAAWDWDEASVQFNGAPGLSFDGNSRTLGINPSYTANGAETSPSNPPLPVSDDLLTLGTLTVGATAAGQTVSFDAANLPVFLTLAAFFEGEAMAGLATIIVEKTNSSGVASFHSKEGDPLLAPRLVLDAIVTPGSASNPDFDGDGDVDGADFLTWQRGVGLTGQMTNANGDANGDGTVDAQDLTDWRNGFAATMPAGASVPEPCTATLTLGLFLAAGISRARSRRAQAAIIAA